MSDDMLVSENVRSMVAMQLEVLLDTDHEFKRTFIKRVDADDGPLEIVGFVNEGESGEYQSAIPMADLEDDGGAFARKMTSGRGGLAKTMHAVQDGAITKQIADRIASRDSTITKDDLGTIVRGYVDETYDLRLEDEGVWVDNGWLAEEGHRGEVDGLRICDGPIELMERVADIVEGGARPGFTHLRNITVGHVDRSYDAIHETWTVYLDVVQDHGDEMESKRLALRAPWVRTTSAGIDYLAKHTGLGCTPTSMSTEGQRVAPLFDLFRDAVGDEEVANTLSGMLRDVADLDGGEHHTASSDVTSALRELADLNDDEPGYSDEQKSAPALRTHLAFSVPHFVGMVVDEVRHGDFKLGGDTPEDFPSPGIASLSAPPVADHGEQIDLLVARLTPEGDPDGKAPKTIVLPHEVVGGDHRGVFHRLAGQLESAPSRRSVEERFVDSQLEDVLGLEPAIKAAHMVYRMAYEDSYDFYGKRDDASDHAPLQPDEVEYHAPTWHQDEKDAGGLTRKKRVPWHRKALQRAAHGAEGAAVDEAAELGLNLAREGLYGVDPVREALDEPTVRELSKLGAGIALHQAAFHRPDATPAPYITMRIAGHLIENAARNLTGGVLSEMREKVEEVADVADVIDEPVGALPEGESDDGIDIESVDVVEEGMTDREKAAVVEREEIAAHHNQS